MDVQPAVAIGVASDQGRQRTENQDSLAIPPPGLSPKELGEKGHLYLVADGIGGHQAGKTASDLVARRVVDEYYRQPPGDVAGALRRAIRIANAEVHRWAQEPGYEKMGTTIVAAVLHGNTLTVAHVGDSRAYLISRDQIQILTRDHTWVTEQIDGGILTQEQADRHAQRHVLTRSLGARPEVLVDLIHTSLRPGDQVLLCSDGLWEAVDLPEIEAAVRSGSPQQAARQLVALANEYGGPDNVTAVLVRPDLGPLSPPLPLPGMSTAGRLGQALVRVLPADTRERWPLLAAAALLVIVALACALALLLGGLPDGNGAPTAASSATPGAATALPGPATTASPGPTVAATVTPTVPADIQGRVSSTLPLAMRQEPRLSGALVAYLLSSSGVTVSCGVPGDAVDGNDTWYRVTGPGGGSGYVAARWIELEGVEPVAVPACSE